MSCCGGNCGCGSGCSCGSSCNGCSKHPDLGLTERAATETIIVGVAPSKIFYELGAEKSFNAENGCKCGSSCSCDPCTC